MLGVMSKYRDPLFDPEDLEAAADEALGLVSSDPRTPAEKRADEEKARLEEVGVKLTGRMIRPKRNTGNAAEYNHSRKMRIFVRTLAATGIISRAAARAGWTTSYAYKLRKDDAEFAAAWDNALEYSTDSVEMEARRRAVEGTMKPVYQQGKLVGHVREYSDSLLTTLLKAKRPNEFRENVKAEVEHKGGVLVVPGVASDDAWEKAAAANQAEHRGNQGDEANDPLG